MREALVPRLGCNERCISGLVRAFVILAGNAPLPLIWMAARLHTSENSRAKKKIELGQGLI